MTADTIKILEDIHSKLGEVIEDLKTPPKTASADSGKKKNNVIPMNPAQGRATSSRAQSRKDREAAEKVPAADSDFTREDLDALSYNNLKKLARDMGISAVGSRDDLTDKIMEAKDSGESASDEKSTKTSKTSKTSKTAKAAKTSKRGLSKPAPAPEPEDNCDEDDDDEDPIIQKVNEAVAEMSNEEIADVLADIGVRAKGKRQTLIAAVVKAVRDGKLELGEDDDEDGEPAEEESPVSDDSNDSDGEVGVNDPDNEDMTDARREALAEYEEDVRNDFDNGDITRSDMIEWLNDYNGAKDASLKKKSDEEILEAYVYFSSLFITDEGETLEEAGAYTVNGVPYCCGRPLDYDEKSGMFCCSHCGETYEASDEE